MSIRVEFDALPWQCPVQGFRYKAFAGRDRRLRLIEFSNGFSEATWCTQGHAFHVLEGSFMLETEGGRTCLAAGDIGFLEAGQRHKASVSGKERALLLMFETD